MKKKTKPAPPPAKKAVKRTANKIPVKKSATKKSSSKTVKKKVVVKQRKKVIHSRRPAAPKPRPVVRIHHPAPGGRPNDIQVRLGNRWETVTSIRESEEGSMFWTSPVFTGNCPYGMWKLK